MKFIKVTGKQFAKLRSRILVRHKRISSSVENIIEDVRLHGDDAVIACIVLVLINLGEAEKEDA